MIFNQIDTKENFISNNEVDSNFHEFSTISIEFKNVKRRRKKFRIIECKRTIIKINAQEIEIMLNSKAKVNLINNILAKQLKLMLFHVFNCQTINVNNHLLKIYDVYFVQFEIKDENDVSRFFNDNFLETNLAWDMTLNLPWIQLSKIKVNWTTDKIEVWSFTVEFVLFITSRIEKIEFEELINVALNDEQHVFVMFVRMFHDEKTNLNSIHIQRRIQIDSTLTKIKNKSNIKISISEILKKFENLINENKAYELSNHESNDHAINLKSNKKSSYDFILFFIQSRAQDITNLFR